MARINHNGRRPSMLTGVLEEIFSRSRNQRRDRFMHVERVNEWLPINQLWRKAHPQLRALPVRHLTYCDKYEQPIAGLEGIARQRIDAGADWRRQTIRFTPAVERNPSAAELLGENGSGCWLCRQWWRKLRHRGRS